MKKSKMTKFSLYIFNRRLNTHRNITMLGINSASVRDQMERVIDMNSEVIVAIYPTEFMPVVISYRK